MQYEKCKSGQELHTGVQILDTHTQWTHTWTHTHTQTHSPELTGHSLTHVCYQVCYFMAPPPWPFLHRSIPDFSHVSCSNNDTISTKYAWRHILCICINISSHYYGSRRGAKTLRTQSMTQVGKKKKRRIKIKRLEAKNGKSRGGKCQTMSCLVPACWLWWMDCGGRATLLSHWQYQPSTETTKRKDQGRTALLSL